MLKFVKPDGRVVEINDSPSNIKAAKNAGWVKETEEVTETLDTRGRPWDERIHTKGRTVGPLGEWKNKQGVSDAEIATVEAENG